MKAENAIEVKDIVKSFKVYFDKSNLLKERILFWKRNRYEKRHVLNGISFTVKKGEAIGLIGHNGCGKSTSLKLLTRIMYPDSGSVEMAGRVSALIELGAGFHPDMSGRENIYTNAAIFGLTKKEIDKKIDDIIAFSELEEFIDNPVRTYSSGMYMRLAFAVAINVDADILLIDEILAVGDAAFQEKCFNRLKEIKAQGTTIVIVSHSLGQIEEICERSIWIDSGLIRAQGEPLNIHREYLEFMGVRKPEDTENLLASFKKLQPCKMSLEAGFRFVDNPEEDFSSVAMKEKEGRGLIEVQKDNPQSVDIELDIKNPVEQLQINVEDSELLTLNHLSAGKKIFSFTLKCSRHAASRIHLSIYQKGEQSPDSVEIRDVRLKYMQEEK